MRNAVIAAALFVGAAGAFLAYDALAKPQLKTHYHALRSDDVVQVSVEPHSVEPRGTCPDAGGVWVISPDGGRDGSWCWWVNGKVSARPKKPKTPKRDDVVSYPADTTSMVTTRALIVAQLPRCASEIAGSEDLYWPLVAEDVVFFAAESQGPCVTDDGGVPSYVLSPDGGVLGCWSVYFDAWFRPKIEGLAPMFCSRRFVAHESQAAPFRAMGKTQVLPVTAERYGLEVAP